jgi:hypothetical protein
MAKFTMFLRQNALLVCIWCCAQTALAQGTATATLKPEVVETGDTFHLFVFVSGVKSTPKEVDFASWTNVFPANNVLSRSEWRRSGTQWVRQFTLISFDSAALALPPLKVLVAVGDPLVTNSLDLKVYPTRGAELSDMAPLRDIYREPVHWTDYWPWALGGLALVAGIFWWRRRSKPKPAVVPIPDYVAPPVVLPAALALQQLEALEKLQLWKQDQVKEHHARISLIVREYLESQYHIAALESTTMEIEQLLRNTSFPPDHAALLQEILQKTDLIKFAQSQPDESFHTMALEKARHLVLPTTPAHTKQPVVANAPKPKRYEPL